MVMRCEQQKVDCYKANSHTGYTDMLLTHAQYYTMGNSLSCRLYSIALQHLLLLRITAGSAAA